MNQTAKEQKIPEIGSQEGRPAATPYPGQRWLVEERDACGVGFIANLDGKASHDIIAKALPALTCLEHRGGCSADTVSGDGAGVQTAVPWQLFKQWFAETGNQIPDPKHTGVGMVFLPQNQDAARAARQIVERVFQQEGMKAIAWRVVPVDPDSLGPQARENMPQIEQVFVSHPSQTGDDLERSLYLARRAIGKAIAASEALDLGDNFYVCSLSHSTITYKGMVRSEVLGRFYLDLKNPAYSSSFAVYHRRFSTNTMPKWPLAQPMRLLGHNGEINTLLGNINWMFARQADLAHANWGDRIEDLKPIVNPSNSDSATLDNAMELLVRSGRSPAEALMLMVPEAYQNQPDLASHPEIIDFYEYYSGIQEAWDGPALLVFSDGKQVGASLDRNGLRPARYCLTNDGKIIVASEAGVVDIPEETIVEKGRLGPGEMIIANLESGEVLKNWEIKERIARSQPYSEWLAAGRQNLPELPFLNAAQFDAERILRQQTAFGYTFEDVETIVQAMASTGKEPTFCMGDDIPLAVLSDKPHVIYDYFKQRFAQVTNPAIDPLREKLVMSLEMLLGDRGNLLEAKPEYARQLKIKTPVLNELELEAIRSGSLLETATLSTLYDIGFGPTGLRAAVENLVREAAAAVLAGKKVLILSDRKARETPSNSPSNGNGNGNGSPTDSQGEQEASDIYIPPLLAVGAVHHHLIRQGLRMKASILIDTAQCWSTHHFACLLGYGASAVCPYLALESVRQWWSASKTQKMMERGAIGTLSISQAQENYRSSVEAGLLKILSKMGISLLSSYQGAQIFEAIGIGSDLLELGFAGTTSRIGGLSCAELARETATFYGKAFPELTVKKLQNLGFIQYRKGGEYHLNNPEMAKLLHKAVGEKQQDYYELYKELLEGRPATALRDLLDFSSDRASIPIEEVESAEEIVKRFCTGGMSLGALSPEAHCTLAIAMNRLGGKSNSGEGGEDPVRFKVLDDVSESGHSETLPYLQGLRNGDTASSGIKQVASGRFGVTPEYLMNAKQIEIKIAQGAKPGEGGQLPGKKVSPYIAMLRRSKPGVTLISPPPHHDIYSIEDLAQLIFDLHQVNPNAKVSVKLVAEIGIGTIAAGVAKANADVIQISGHDGGTGASPLSSIKHAGVSWELGLTEVHRVLMQNKLRDRVILRTDGGLKTGWDVLMAALMGAEEYGFGSIAMIAEGCIMARICHTNNCPVGVATQQEKLRKRFPGVPEHVVNFFLFVAQEVRSILAKLGYRSLNEVIGRADLLRVRPVSLAKTESINLDCLLQLPDTRSDRSWLEHEPVHENGAVLDDWLLVEPDVIAAIQNHSSIDTTMPIANTSRCVGARVAGRIASLYGNNGWKGSITVRFRGSAGQSFGAFNLPGMTLILEGESADYVGKGMHGGEIIIKPQSNSQLNSADNVIIGNTCLYGATGGVLFASGKAGERFAVRNSKGQAVIEGAGDHCCEYMTGGVVVVLGKVGRNVGAGQTGGLGYFLDEDGSFPAKVNPEIVKIQRVTTAAGEQQLKELIQAHGDRTGSNLAAKILANWDEYLPKFYQVVPPSEENTPEASSELVEEKVAVNV